MTLETVDRKDGILLCRVAYGSDLYHLSKSFREALLRKPLGLDLSAIDLQGEDVQHHFAAVQDARDIVGTVILKSVSPEKAKLRQMAVSPVTQGQGLGKGLVMFAEEFARQKGIHSIEMIARTSAQGFYERLGYRTVGAEFTDPAIPVASIIMEKNL